MIIIPANKLKSHWTKYLLVLLPLSLVLFFSYAPIVSGFIHIFYRWDGDMVREFIGLNNLRRMIDDRELWRSLGVLLIFILANFIKMIPPLFAALVLHHIAGARWQYVYRICFVIPMIIPAMVFILMWKYFLEPNQGAINELLRTLAILGPTQSIAWLSDASLVIWSLILVGFPWVGAFGVLVYLAGLQNISNDIYEAAAIEGAGPLRVFWNVELPLIMTQVRINLVLTIIATIQGWEFVYLFVGEAGGPKGMATVPGLLIFRESFSHGYFGYGCAIGFLLFLVTLALTWVNNRYIRVDK